MVRVYISGPISAATEQEVRANVAMADKVGRELAALGYNPFIPHKQTEGWHNSTDFTREQFLSLDFDWLNLCHAVYMLPGWEKSLGAIAEYEEARRSCIPVVHSIDELQALFPCPGHLPPIETSPYCLEPQVIFD